MNSSGPKGSGAYEAVSWDAALAEFRDRAGGVATSSFYFHYARLIEVLAAAEGATGRTYGEDDRADVGLRILENFGRISC